jgi:large subunit ribosomal protein L25
MKTVSLSGTPRAYVGKKDAKRQRREGMVPCVMYGRNEQVSFITGEKNFRKIIFTPEVYIVKLDIGGEVHDTIIQDVQYHPVTDHILHVDFLELIPDKPVIISVPVKLTGTSSGVLKGGKLNAKMRKVKVKAMIDDLPDDVVLDISNLEIGDSIKISSLQKDKMKFLDPPNSVIVGVRTARAIVEEVPGAEAVAAEAAAAAAAAEGAPAGQPGKGAPGVPTKGVPGTPAKGAPATPVTPAKGAAPGGKGSEKK